MSCTWESVVSPANVRLIVYPQAETQTRYKQFGREWHLFVSFRVFSWQTCQRTLRFMGPGS